MFVWTKLVSKLCLSVMLCMTAACSTIQGSAPFYTVVSEATLKAGDTLPAPTGDVILTVTGKVGVSNQNGAIVMDRAMIEAAGQIEYKVTDPFEELVYTYRGPLMSDLLKLWKVPADAVSVSVAALDDYIVEIPLVEFANTPAIFALQRDNQYMPMSTRGPAMIVFPYDNFQFNHQIFNDYWAWQIKSMEIK